MGANNEGRETERIMRGLVRAGYEVAISNGGHWIVRANGSMTSCAKSPRDQRWRKNLIADLRRLGINIDRSGNILK
jgi:hypothetical protein